MATNDHDTIKRLWIESIIREHFGLTVNDPLPKTITPRDRLAILAYALRDALAMVEQNAKA